MGDMPQQPSPSVHHVRRVSEGDPFPTGSGQPPSATTVAAAVNNTQAQHPETLNQDEDRVDSVLAVLGLGKNAIQRRKALVVLLWSIAWSLIQVCVACTGGMRITYFTRCRSS